MPAAAVIPAPIAYRCIAAIKKLVVGLGCQCWGVIGSGVCYLAERLGHCHSLPQCHYLEGESGSSKPLLVCGN